VCWEMQVKKLVFIANKKDVPRGEAKVFRFPTGDRPALLIHLQTGEFVAYDGLCTHLQGELYWDKNLQKIACSFHDGLYHPEHGGPYRGLPQKSLPSINLEIEDNGDIYAVKE